ncbi:hypothetical protein SAICODRAFT_9867 [Saitoella complicata NRRL Y-17804]|nr:uncharacterized protein SAICODRAFT_9867 [Saitoella complicata NRRL Y-17804]ODQ50599.1 hypothetical protein SAICODRAFT_9867 [Saitoella complicata NRRL Y-17804]
MPGMDGVQAAAQASARPASRQGINGQPRAASSRASTVDPRAGLAPRHIIPSGTLYSVEHPASKITNIDKAIKTLGGQKGIDKFVFATAEEIHTEPHAPNMSIKPLLELRMRPDDHYSHPIAGIDQSVQNILIRITRRKLKSAPPTQKGDIHKIEAIGVIERTARFRDLADFQICTGDSPFQQDFGARMESMSLERIISYKPQPDPADLASEPWDMQPPPLWSRDYVPANYHYKANPASIKFKPPNGPVQIINKNRAPKLFNITVTYDIPSVPTEPSRALKKPSTLEMAVIAKLRQLFRERPLWTRWGLRREMGMYNPDYLPSLKNCLAHVCYIWKSGPWRDTYCAYGIDPRTSPEFAKYQCLFFMLGRKAGVSNVKVVTEGRNESGKGYPDYRFTGHQLSTPVRAYQVCDVTDPLLKDIIERGERDLRETLRERSGWFRGGVWKKVRRIMRAKLVALNGDPPRVMSDAEFLTELNAPEEDDEESVDPEEEADAEGDDDEEEEEGENGEEGGTKTRKKLDERVNELMRSLGMMEQSQELQDSEEPTREGELEDEFALLEDDG